MSNFDVAIIGGGHAGLEAACISAQFGHNVAIFTLPGVAIASAPCNPAVGGVGKGQVVREIDALGGVMGKLADMSAIQYRILNESKGYAVQSTRVQIDKELYARNAENLVAGIENLTVVREKVDGLEKSDSVFKITTSETTYTAKKVVITTGTFLNGKLHTGEEQEIGGRVGAMSSKGLVDLFAEIQTAPNRFKTGTPARLKKDTIDFSVMDPQESEPRTENFHFAHDPYERFVEQVSCYLTRTNENTLGIIRANKERSPIFNGQIQGIGPRYCPSIEDKAFRYLDRHSHHVFVEPESHELNTVYPNGISTSLPKEVQLEFIRTIPGLENAEIEVHGYAVEYDVVDTSKLNIGMEYIDVPGLYFAGQVNGTSGYEEAAGQGIVAGINASLSLVGKEPLIIDRNDSYIGVMVEDLVSNKRDEPYRLFTARAENRLYVREDNTVLRMSPYRQYLELFKDVDKYQQDFLYEYDLLKSLALTKKYRANTETKEYFTKYPEGTFVPNMNLDELLRRPQLDPVETLKNELASFGVTFMPEVVKAVAISTKYDGYITKAKQENEKLRKLSQKKIDWKKLVESHNISNECRQRIEQIQPLTFGQLQKIDGIRPATLAYVAGNVL